MDFYDNQDDTCSSAISMVSSYCQCGGYFISDNDNFSQYCGSCGMIEVIEQELESNNNTFPIYIIGARSGEFTKELFKSAKSNHTDLTYSQILAEFMIYFNKFETPPFNVDIIVGATNLYVQLQKLIIKRRESTKKAMAGCLRYAGLELNIALSEKTIMEFMDMKGKKINHCIIDIQRFIDSGEIKIGEIDINRAEISSLLNYLGFKHAEFVTKLFKTIEETYICAAFNYNCRIAGIIYVFLLHNKFAGKEIMSKICKFKDITNTTINNYIKIVSKYRRIMSKFTLSE